MASPHSERKLPYLPAEIWSKIRAEVSKHDDFREFVALWTQYRRVSSVLKSEIEKTLIDQHLKKPTIYVDPFVAVSHLLNQESFKAGKMSEEEMMEPDIYGVPTAVCLALTFYALAPEENEITFQYQGESIETDEWPNLEYLSGRMMLRPNSMLMHTTCQHLPVQIEWINRNEQVTLSLTFDWKQLFSMFIARDSHTHSLYFVYRRFHFGRPCRWPSGVDGTVRMCREHEAGQRYVCPLLQFRL